MGVMVEIQDGWDDEKVLATVRKTMADVEADSPHTIAELKARDRYIESTIRRAERSKGKNGGWFLDTDEGSGFFISDEKLTDWRGKRGRLPKVGMSVRIYSNGFGSSYHGVDLDGDEVYWETPAERKVSRADWLAHHDREKREEFEAEKPKLDADYESLPPKLKARIDRFRAKEPGFRVDSEGYELFCCTEAMKFYKAALDAAEHESDARAVAEFWRDEELRSKAYHGDLSESVWAEKPDSYGERWLLWAWAINSKAYDYDYERQRKVLGSSDDHSGNTFGAAMSMALRLLRSQEV